MIWFVLISVFLIIGLLVLSLFFIKFTISIAYRVNFSETHRIHLTISLLKINWWKRSIYLPTLTEYLSKDNTNLNSISRIDWKKIIPLLEKIKLSKLDWETGIGTGTAHHTGFITGLIWACKELTIRTIEAYGNLLHQPNLKVQPNYHGEGFYSKLDCDLILSYRTYKKIQTVLKEVKDTDGG